MPLVCESCQQAVRAVHQQANGALWCKRCRDAALDVRPANGVKDDTIIGGTWIHNLGPEPVFVQSESERRTLMRSRGLREALYNQGPNDQHCPSWQTMDARTLANAAELVSRNGGYQPEWKTVKMRNPFTGERITVDYDSKNPETKVNFTPLTSQDTHDLSLRR